MHQILVVEDDESLRFSFEKILQRAGYLVTAVPTIAAALTAASVNPPDAVVADILLGGEDGLDLPEALRLRGHDIPVLLITGNPSVDTASRAVAANAFSYLIKPVQREDLLAAVARACEHKALCDERKALAEELQQLRAHLEAVFRSVPDILVSVDGEGRVVRINDAGMNALRVSPGDVQGQRWQDVLQGWGGQLGDVLRHALESRDVLPKRRVSIPLEDGARQVFEVSASPLSGESGEHLGAVLMMRDITRIATGGRGKDSQDFYGIVGTSVPMRKTYHLLEDLAPTDTTVLITGESGTGKELVAEALHNAGPRATGPLVKVNCSALPETLLESELFGHVRGAFTGASRDRVGRFQLAHGGTIFLDEIGDISLQVQLRLLRVLQEREFERVGDTKTTRVDVRVIAATNRNLRELVAHGHFREDLYYRLRVVELHIPPLRERPEDIMLLADYFVGMFNDQFQRMVSGFTDAARRALLTYRWPGNVRELRHAVEHGFILCKYNTIDLADLPNDVQGRTEHGPDLYRRSGVDQKMLLAALQRAGGNKAKAARTLGVSRQTFYRKMREFGLQAE